jgi:hypothetical protein
MTKRPANRLATAQILRELRDGALMRDRLPQYVSKITSAILAA